MDQIIGFDEYQVEPCLIIKYLNIDFTHMIFSNQKLN